MTLYEILDIPADSSPEALKGAFLNKARTLHPDADPNSNGAPSPEWTALKEAYDALRDPQKRHIYDVTGLIAGNLEDDLDIAALSLIRKYATEILAGNPYGDIVRMICKRLSDNLGAMRRQALHLGGVATAFESSATRVEKNWHGAEKVRDAVIEVLHINAKNAEMQKSQQEKELKPVERALEMLADARCEAGQETVAWTVATTGWR